MAHPHDKPDEPSPPLKDIRLREPGSGGGLQEFVYALAAILARLDAEQQRRIQSNSPQDSKEQGKELP